MISTFGETGAHGRSVQAWMTMAAALAALGLVFLPEWDAAVRVWVGSTAYSHCFLVAPMALFLVWDRRERLRGLAAQPAPKLALAGLPLPLLWLAADRFGVMEARQLVAMSFVELLFLVGFGPRLFKALCGPLLFLYFLVPFGAFLTPALQAFTAWFIGAGLSVMRIPHFANSMYIEVSSGMFHVAEACAGLRFLIASIAFGCFYSILNFRDLRRQLVFIAVSAAVPIIANGIRALGIVVLGEALGSAQAAAADHLLYGWAFFSIVMLLLVASGRLMREDGTAGRVERDASRAADAYPAQWVFAVVLLAMAGPAAAFAFEA